MCHDANLHSTHLDMSAPTADSQCVTSLFQYGYTKIAFKPQSLKRRKEMHTHSRTYTLTKRWFK